MLRGHYTEIMYFFGSSGSQLGWFSRLGVVLIGVTALLTMGGWNWGTTDQANSSGGERLSCDKCPALKLEIRKFQAEAENANLMLTRQQQEFQNVDPNETSKRMKLAASLFVSAAQLETAQNREKFRRGQWDYSCGKCAGSEPKTSR